MNEKLMIAMALVLATTIAIPQAKVNAQGDTTLRIYVDGAFPDHNYKICADYTDELQRIYDGCTNFKGSEFENSGQELLELEEGTIYGCVIDQDISAYSCDSIQTRGGYINMYLDLGKPSKLPLPSETTTSNDNNNDNDNGNDEGADDSLPEDGGCQEHDDYCDKDEGCRSEKVDCIDDRNFDEDDYAG
jgi:hypothetical protein